MNDMRQNAQCAALVFSVAQYARLNLQDLDRVCQALSSRHWDVETSIACCVVVSVKTNCRTWLIEVVELVVAHSQLRKERMRRESAAAVRKSLS